MAQDISWNRLIYRMSERDIKFLLQGTLQICTISFVPQDHRQTRISTLSALHYALRQFPPHRVLLLEGP